MARKVRTTFLYSLGFIVFLVSIYHHLFRDSISDQLILRRPSPLPLKPHHTTANQLIHEHVVTQPHSSSLLHTTISILFPAWEVLVVVSPEPPLDSIDDEYICLFPNNDTSPAKPSGILPLPNRPTFSCVLPNRVRRRLPFLQPVLAKSKGNPPARVFPAPELLRWNFLAYDTLSTENDVVLFVKGVNKRQGINREPTEFRCVFGDDVANAVKTSVTSSLQEVFRCQRPELTSASPSGGNVTEERIKVSLEFWAEKRVVPSIAYYTPTRKTATTDHKSLLCACTMVYNVAKFLKEWVTYHSRIGIQKFILYDNGSDDDLAKVMEGLVKEGYDVSALFWLWPKTQEAGFSHCAMYAKDTCTWMAYIDVDEFVYSPLWSNSSNHPSKSLLKSLLPKPYSTPNYDVLSVSSSKLRGKVGQVMIGCHEFGPSNQKLHPVMGVMQGYNCRKRLENRHKSIVLLDAIHESLLNVIHHFNLKEGYRVKRLNIEEAVVNHYKFQAWPEFKAKFRRRVSAYVVDWTEAVNPSSNDRTPGLGFAPVEPKGWPHKFCQVYDNRLKDLTQRWFEVKSPSGYHMAWQR